MAPPPEDRSRDIPGQSQHRPPPESQGDNGLGEPVGTPRPASRVLNARVPVWLFLGTILAVGGMFGVLLLAEARSAVDLGPAVGNAERVEVRLTLCNADVDRLEINPRATELRLEKLLRQEGAASTQVVVDRRDCPAPPG